MIPELHGLASILNTTHQLFHRALEGITPAQALQRRDQANPILWIAGHIVTVRADFLRSIGGEADIPWAKHFRRGGEVKNESLWPAVSVMRAKWDEVHGAFMSRLDILTSKQLMATTDAPGLDKTLMGTIGLAALHDGYHVGQLAAARRLYGLDRIVG